MKTMLILLSVLMVSLRLFAVSVKLPANVTSFYSDKTSIFDTELPADRFDDLRQFKLTIRIEATVSNAVCLRLGRDGLYGNSDNALSLEETLLEIGIERNGEMYLLKNRLKERFVHTLSNPATPQERTITLKVRVAPDNPSDVRSVIFEENGALFTFSGLDLDPIPVELNPVMWTDLRLLVRNGGTQSVEIKFMKDGSLIIVR